MCPIPCHKYIPFREEKKERGQHNTVQNLVRSHTRFAVSGVFICGFAVLIQFFCGFAVFGRFFCGTVNKNQ